MQAFVRFMYIKLIVLQREKKREKEREAYVRQFPSISSLFKCKQWLGWTKARS